MNRSVYGAPTTRYTRRLPLPTNHDLVDPESDRLSSEFKLKYNRLRAEARRICDSSPNICFFRIFGKKIDVDKLKSLDPKSDIDLRCVYQGSITEEEKNTILKQLSKIMDPRPVEVQFTEISDYEKGQIGKQGTFTVNELLTNPQLYELHPDIRLKHPQLVSLYDLTTGLDFSHLKEEIDSQYGGKLNISNLLESVQLTQESGEEWADIFFLQFLKEYHKNKSEYTLEYTQRLAKFCIRTAFCLLVAQTPKERLPQLKEEIIFELNDANGFGDLAFLNLLHKKKPPWLRKWHEILLFIGRAVRETNTWILNLLEENIKNPPTDDRLSDRKRLKQVFNMYCTQAEQLMFELANVSSGHDRRNKDSFDPMVRGGLEFLLQRVLSETHPEFYTERKNGEQFITEGTRSDCLYFIPRETKDGRQQAKDKTQGVALHLPNQEKKADQVIIKDIGRIVGDLGPLLDRDRTTSVTVITDGEPLEMYEIPKDFILALFNDPKVLKMLRHPELCDTREDSNRLHLYTLLLKYFSYEFVSTVRDIEKLSETNHSTAETPDLLKENNPFSEFLTDDLGTSVLELFNSEADTENFEVIDCKENTILFSPNDPQSEYLFIAISSANDFAVEATNFAGNPDTKITIAPNIFFGDSSLLRFGTRSATVTALPGSVILKCSVVEFEKLTSNYGLLSNGQSVQELLFAVAATNLGRINRSLPQK